MSFGHLINHFECFLYVRHYASNTGMILSREPDCCSKKSCKCQWLNLITQTKANVSGLGGFPGWLIPHGDSGILASSTL